MIDITQHNKKDEFAKTCYTGTKDDLINAGLATPSMFETVQGRARTSRLCKNYHPESGDWQVLNRGERRNKQIIWDVVYFHERFIDTATLKREKEVEEWAKLLERLPDDRKKKVRNCILLLRDKDPFVTNTFGRAERDEISAEEAIDIIWEYSH